jgi:hypothetical protein
VTASPENPAHVRPGAAPRPAERPAPAPWRAVLDALLLDDAQVLEALAARGSAAGLDASD